MDRVIHRTRNVVTTLILGLMCTTSGFILITMEDGLDARLIGVVFLVGGAWTLIRAGFVGVTISDRGVVVRNLWRTYRLPWSEVDSIDPPGE